MKDKITDIAELEQLILDDEIDGYIAYYQVGPDTPEAFFDVSIGVDTYIPELWEDHKRDGYQGSLAQFQVEILVNAGVAPNTAEYFVIQ